VVKVKPTSDAEVDRSAVTRGNAGVYVSVANGGTALCNANVNTNDVDTAGPAALVGAAPAAADPDGMLDPPARRNAPPPPAG